MHAGQVLYQWATYIPTPQGQHFYPVVSFELTNDFTTLLTCFIEMGTVSHLQRSC